MWHSPWPRWAKVVNLLQEKNVRDSVSHQHALTLNRNPGGMSALSEEAPPSTVPLTVAGKVSTTTAGREVWKAADRKGKTSLRKENPKWQLLDPPWRIHIKTITYLGLPTLSKDSVGFPSTLGSDGSNRKDSKGSSERAGEVTTALLCLRLQKCRRIQSIFLGPC